MNRVLLLVFLILFGGFTQAQTSPGDVAFIAMNADGGDDFAIVTLVDIAASTTIFFTDNEPLAGGGISSGEGILQWISPASVVAAGTVVVFSDASTSSRNASIGSLSSVSGAFNLAGGGDALFAFIGTASAPTAWLAGIQNESGNQGSLAGAGLSSGTTFVDFYVTSSPDGGYFSGLRNTENSFADYLAIIGNMANWSEEVSNGELILPIDNTPFTLASTPDISITPGALSGLDYVFGSGPSVGMSVVVSAQNLSPAAGNISITEPSGNFAFSQTLGGTYTASLTLPFTGGALANTDVYVRLVGSLAIASYNSTVTASIGATTETFTVSGNVTAPCSITASGLSAVTCDFNTTPTDVSDDIITFDLNPTGTTLGASYSISSAGGGVTTLSPNSTISYGSATTITTNAGAAGGGDFDVTIVDVDDPTCTFTFTVTDPGTCFTNAPACFATQSFEGGGSWSYTSNRGDATLGYDLMNGDEWHITANQGGNTASDGSSLWGFQDILNSSHSGDHILEFASTNVSAYTSVEVSFDWFAEAFNSTDEIGYELQLDGGAWNRTVLCSGICNTQTSGALNTTETIVIPAMTNTVALRLYGNQNGGGQHGGFDNVQLCGVVASAIPELQLVNDAAGNEDCGSFTLDAGAISPSTSVNSTFDIENVGTDDLEITSLVVSGLDMAQFAVVSPVSFPITLAPAGVQTVTVSYTAPATTGTHAAILTIHNDDADEGTCVVDLSGESSSSIPIPDNGCATNTEIENNIVYTGSGGNIVDIDVFVSITHPFRADLQIELESPAGTIVQLLDGSTGSSSDNLEVNFDDEAGATLGSTNHVIDGVIDETVESAGSGILATFDGEDPNGTWILRICDDGVADVGSLEDWDLIITEDCTPTHTVSGVAPTNGPALTHVTITGTNFTPNTTVSLNGLALDTVSSSATEIIVEIPANGSTGSITVTESACDVVGANYTFNNTEACTSAPGGWTGDILISGVYDETNGSCHYIELYNPAGTAVDLSTYSLGSDNNASSANAAIPGIYNGTEKALSGTIPAFGTFMIKASTNGSTCNSCINIEADLQLFNFGYNGVGIDRVFLINNGTEIDLWAQDLGFTDGFVYARSSSSTAPNLTYSNADWNGQNTADCFGFEAVVQDPPTISALMDVSSCVLTMSATTAAGNGGTLSHEWYYNDNVTGTWSILTNSSFTGLTVAGETTPTISITSGANNITDIENYQFHLKVIEDGTCSKFSNTFQFLIGNERYFRVANNGDWSDITTWEIANNPAGPYAPSCVSPDGLNSDSILIDNGDTVTLDIDVSADQILVQAGGVLILNEELVVSNGNLVAEDITIEGTLIDNGSSANGLVFESGASWILGASGTIIKTSNSSVNAYRDNYEAGIASIPSTANWYFSFDGSSDVSLSTIGMYYPNLFFESQTVPHEFDGFSEVFKGSSNGAIVKGDLNIGTTGMASVTVFNNNINAIGVTIEGNLLIGAGSVFSNEQMVFGAGNGFGANIILNGNATIDGVLDNSFGIGNLQLVGAANQVMDGSGSLVSHDVLVNNAANVNLDGITLEINNELTFTAGKILTDVSMTNVVQINNNANTALIGASASSYVEGKLLWLTDGASAYTFPVGDAAQGLQSFVITPTGVTNSSILGFLETNSQALVQSLAFCDLEVHPGGGVVNAGNGNTGFDGVLDKIEFDLASTLQWNITNPSADITSYDLTVNANGGQDIIPVVSANGVAVRYLMKNGEPGNTGFATTTGGSAFPFETGFNACPNQYSLTGLTSFSNFTLNGASQANTTLPVELLSLQANAIDNEFVQVQWSTATEINNAGFELLRSTDGVEFYSIAWIEGNGNSTEIWSYGFEDEELTRNVTYYYRLNQIDFDGTETLSEIVSAKLTGSHDDVIQVYPNPATSSITIENKYNILSVRMFDFTGKLVLKHEFTPAQQCLFNVNRLATGTYFIEITTANKVYFEKLLIE